MLVVVGWSVLCAVWVFAQWASRNLFFIYDFSVALSLSINSFNHLSTILPEYGPASGLRITITTFEYSEPDVRVYSIGRIVHLCSSDVTVKWPASMQIAKLEICHVKNLRKKIIAKLFIYVILGSFRFISGWNQPYFMQNIIIYRDNRKPNRERIFRHIFWQTHSAFQRINHLFVVSSIKKNPMRSGEISGLTCEAPSNA